MNGNEDSYWSRGVRRPYSRRTLLRSAALAGTGLAGAFAFACGGSKSKSSTETSPAASGSQAAATAKAGPAQINQADSLSGLASRSGKAATGETPIRGGTYVGALNGNPPTLDPQNTISINTGNPASAALSRLFRWKTFYEVRSSFNREIEPDLALSQESPDAVTWTFKLRPDARFHNVAPVNGHAVTSTDVKASFTRAVAPTSGNRGSLLMIDPSKIETPDDQTVIFKLNYPYAPFPKILASAIFAWVLPREATDGSYDPAKKMIGSGPFILDSYTPDVSLIFKRNPEWFEKGRPYIDGVKLAIVPDPQQRLAQFSGGNIDLVGVLQEDVPTMTKQNPKAEIIQGIGNGNGIMYYQLGAQSSIFQDIRLRQAASLAADRNAYGKVYYGDKFIRTFNVTPDFGKWVITWDELPQETKQWYDFDMQKARQLMEAAGGSKLSIKMVYLVGNPADPLLKNQSETIFSMLKQLPWNISYVPLDYVKDWQVTGQGYGFGKMPADSMAWWGLAIRTDVDEYLYGFWHSKGSTNISALNDAKLDAMIDKARGIIDENERLKAYKDVQRYLLDNVYSLCGMVNGVGYTFVQPRVRNFLLGDAWGPGANNWGQLWLASS